MGVGDWVIGVLVGGGGWVVGDGVIGVFVGGGGVGVGGVVQAVTRRQAIRSKA